MSLLTNLIRKIVPRNKIKVGWLLLGDINTGSSRIHGLNIHHFLLNNGIDSTILQSNSSWTRRLTISEEEQEMALLSGINILVFQKVFDEKAIAFAEKARQRGIKTVFILADKYDTEMVNTVDQLVVTSAFLKNYFCSVVKTPPLLIQDAVEVPERRYKTHNQKASLQLVWVGHSDNWESLSIINDALKSRNDTSIALKTISNHPAADVQWDLESVYDEVLTGDIGVIPALPSDWGQSKSNNRLTMFMALGMPVIASEIPAYQNILCNGQNGFLAKSQEDWLNFLDILRDERVRAMIGARARRDASVFSMSNIGRQWMTLFERLLK